MVFADFHGADFHPRTWFQATTVTALNKELGREVMIGSQKSVWAVPAHQWWGGASFKVTWT